MRAYRGASSWLQLGINLRKYCNPPKTDLISDVDFGSVIALMPWQRLSFGLNPLLLKSQPRNAKCSCMIEVFCALRRIPCSSKAPRSFDMHPSPSIIFLYCDPMPLLVNPCKTSSTYADPIHLCRVFIIVTPWQGCGNSIGICPS